MKETPKPDRLGRDESPDAEPRLERDYEVLGSLGRDELGEVFVATDRFTQINVAVKRFDDWTCERERSRAAYAEALAALREQPIDAVPLVIDYRIDPIEAFVASELVEDFITLEDFIAATDGLSLADGIEVMLGVLDVLKELHDVGLVHGGLTPRKVLLTNGADRHGLYVTDPGQFELWRVDNPIQTSRSAPERYLGSAQYYSPEAARGKRPTVKSDVYTAGLLFYEALAGKPPFSANSFATTLKRQIYERPLSPRQSKPGLELPPAAESLIECSLAKNPDHRFDTAEAFYNAIVNLRELVAEEGVVRDVSGEAVATTVRRDDQAAEAAQKKAEEAAELKAKEEAERKAKEEAEKKAKLEAKKTAKEEAERKAKEEAEKKAKLEAEKKAKEEAEKKAREEAEKKAKEEAELKAKEKAEKKAKEEAERKQEAERKAQEKADQKAKRKAKRRAKRKGAQQPEADAEAEVKTTPPLASDEDDPAADTSRKTVLMPAALSLKRQQDGEGAAPLDSDLDKGWAQLDVDLLRPSDDHEAAPSEDQAASRLDEERIGEVSADQAVSGELGAVEEPDAPSGDDEQVATKAPEADVDQERAVADDASPREADEVESADTPSEPAEDDIEGISKWFDAAPDEIRDTSQMDVPFVDARRWNVRFGAALLLFVAVTIGAVVLLAGQHTDSRDDGSESESARDDTPSSPSLAAVPDEPAPTDHPSTPTPSRETPGVAPGTASGTGDAATEQRPTDSQLEPEPTLPLDPTPLVADEPEPAPVPEVAAATDVPPEPVVADEPEHAPLAVVEEPEPVAAIEESEPEPVAVVDEPEPEPVAVIDEPEPEPVAVVEEPEPEPVAVVDEPEPEPVAVVDEPEPEPVAVVDEPEPEPVAQVDESVAAAAQGRSQSRELSRLGEQALDDASYDSAEELFRQAVEHDSRNARAYAGLGDVYFQRGDFSTARRYHRQAVGFASRNASFHSRLGMDYFRLGRFEDAIASWEEALALDSSDDSASRYIDIARQRLAEQQQN